MVLSFLLLFFPDEARPAGLAGWRSGVIDRQPIQEPWRGQRGVSSLRLRGEGTPFQPIPAHLCSVWVWQLGDLTLVTKEGTMALIP